MARIMKKLIALALSLCLLFSATGFVFAAEIPERGLNLVKGDDYYSIRNYSGNTRFDGIKVSPDGYYAKTISPSQDDTVVKNSEDSINIPVGRLDISLYDDDAVSEVLARNDISNEVKDEIIVKHQLAVTTNNKNLTATLFSPDLLPETPMTRGYQSTYYTYN